MGTGASKRTDDGSHGGEEPEEEEHLDQGGGQLYVSLKMENNYKLKKSEVLPHIFGSVPLVGSWDASKALSMERESTSMWELSFVVPPNHETLDFKFLLKPRNNNAPVPCVVEEGPNRQLIGGALQGDQRLAIFRLNSDEVLEYRVFIKADRVSPFDLAASWRAYQDNLRPSAVRGIPDVSLDTVPEIGAEVGLPARGKTFTAAKLTRYLRWLGHDTKHFNIGKYRRLKHGANQTADFFRPDNPEGMEARNEVAALAFDDMVSWMQEGGQVGIFDATNSSRKRRNMLMKLAEGKCKIIFLETLCNDERIIERNIRLKIQQSPDYAEQTDFEAGLQDFKSRLAYYEKVYEPVEEGSYIKMIDMVSGHGGQIQVNNISGYLPGRIVFFLKLANFVEKRLKSERAASIWTSTLQRTILTASPIVGFPKIQWRALDEINAGACDGMTYEEIQKNMPNEARNKDKLRYRYPRGESYLDVIQRLEPVIIELERQRAPVVVISHQAVLRALYAYFADRPLKEVPHIEMPLHTIIEIQMGVTGVQEKRYKLMD
ncbi:hypothetical protein C1H46_022290 [Malus baccata]|uniref:CBM20 domain-containing protein n=1 Tax=Malus baccata TaxID=106549 RepID=A0A540M081_MALBA|nr:hypothetical protein C1H46_022290 [Malus baccata]